MFIDEESHGHHGDATTLNRLNPLRVSAAGDFRCLVGDPQHGGSVGAVDVCIQKPNFQTLLG